jgi:hypothetical protein
MASRTLFTALLGELPLPADTMPDAAMRAPLVALPSTPHGRGEGTRRAYRAYAIWCIGREPLGAGPDTVVSHGECGIECCSPFANRGAFAFHQNQRGKWRCEAHEAHLQHRHYRIVR